MKRLTAIDVPGLYCDDITFCWGPCEMEKCPRNPANIRDRSVPHSFTKEAPADCPKAERRKSVMNSRKKIINELRFQLDSKEVKDQHYPVQLSASDANAILDMLKEQEPRVMTLEEVKAFGWDYCYLEEERLPGKEYRRMCGDYALTCITWPYIASMRIQHGDDSYGQKWRCWSAKPTDEQRQDVKWE